jgi:2-deoxy-D-gluconate 3-dehydrogenase
MILDQFKLNGKRALVVGGAGDLGRSILTALLEAGASAVVADIADSVHNVANDLAHSGHTVHSQQIDITDRLEVRRSVEEARDILAGPLDILVNSAGITRRTISENFSDEDWDAVLAVNLTAAFTYCREAGRQMLQNGYGKIINIASMQSFLGGITIPAYAASKGGIAQLTKALSNDWAGRGINVNAIAPGYMNTRLNTALINDPVRHAEVISRIPRKRWGSGEDLKGVAVFLASPASDYVCGSVIAIDGGFLSR